MSKIPNGAPNDPAALKEHRILDNTELETVTGGFFGGLGNDTLDGAVGFRSIENRLKVT